MPLELRKLSLALVLGAATTTSGCLGELRGLLENASQNNNLTGGVESPDIVDEVNFLGSAFEDLIDALVAVQGAQGHLDNADAKIDTLMGNLGGNTESDTRTALGVINRDIESASNAISEDMLQDGQNVLSGPGGIIERTVSVMAGLSAISDSITKLSGNLGSNTEDATQGVLAGIGASVDMQNMALSDATRTGTASALGIIDGRIENLPQEQIPPEARDDLDAISGSITTLSNALSSGTPRDLQDTLAGIRMDLSGVRNDLPGTGSSNSQRSLNVEVVGTDLRLRGTITSSTSRREAVATFDDNGRIVRLRVTDENGVSVFPNSPDGLELHEGLTRNIANPAFLPAVVQRGNRSVLDEIDDPDFQDGDIAAIVEGFEFSGYGAWAVFSEDGTDDSLESLNAESFGDANTPEAVAAQTGSATYRGGTAGIQVDDASDEVYGTVSNFRAEVDFDNDSLGYMSTNTHRLQVSVDDANDDNVGFISAPSLDFRGEASITGAGFQSTTTGQSLTGTFYGDADSPAQEIGGEFSIDAMNYLGSFGAERASP